MTDQLKNNLSALHLKAMAQHLDAVFLQSEEKNLSFSATLLHLTEMEVERRWQNAVKLRWEQSRLPEKPIVTKFSWFLFIARHYGIGGLPGQANLVF